MIARIRDLLLTPRAFFEACDRKEPDLKVPSLIVLSGAVMAALSAYMVSGITGRMLDPSGGGMGMIIGLVGTLSAFIMVIIAWLVFSGIAFALSMVLKGNGPFTRTFSYIGFGYLPMVISAAVNLLLTLIYIPLVKVPEISSITDPVAVQEAITSFMADPAMKELSLISLAVTALFIVWSSSIWIFGMQQARALSQRDAALSILIPVALYICVSAAMLLTGGLVSGVGS